jgi:tyrosine-protein phosphatase YwqE
MFSFLRKNKTPLTTLFPENFIDIHSHILPGIDDGSKNLEESLAIIQRMQSYGINNIVATPHIMESVWENTPSNINNKLTELQAYLNTTGISNFNIRAAAEYLIDSNFNKLLKTEKLLTIKDSYILVEISYLNAPLNLYEILFNIQIEGYKPILAHPERYLFYHSNYKEYQKLKDAGCLFQLNLLSLSNYYGSGVKQVAQKLLENNMYNFVGTDTHHSRHLDFLERIDNQKITKLVTPLLEQNTLLL